MISLLRRSLNLTAPSSQLFVIPLLYTLSPTKHNSNLKLKPLKPLYEVLDYPIDLIGFFHEFVVTAALDDGQF